MKKALIAAAVLGVYGGTAFAQSSLTLYGLLDEGIVIQSNNRITAQNVATGNQGRGRTTLFPRFVGRLERQLLGLEGLRRSGWRPVCSLPT